MPTTQINIRLVLTGSFSGREDAALVTQLLSRVVKSAVIEIR